MTVPSARYPANSRTEFSKPSVGRGLCVADFDNDGDLDFALSNNGGAAELWRNDGGNKNNWIGFDLVGTKSNGDGVGAKIWVMAGADTQYQQRLGGGSYLSASDPRIFFGLGKSKEADLVRILWPSGLKQEFRDLTANQYFTLTEGRAASPRAAAKTQRWP